MINDIDRNIMNIIQDNGRVSNADIARQVGMVPSGTLERIRKLEANGHIQGYTARINPNSVDLGLMAFVFIRSTSANWSEALASRLIELTSVLEVHEIVGDDSYLAKLRAKDTDDLARILKEEIGGLPDVALTRTTIVLKSLKDTTILPIRDTATINESTPEPQEEQT